jgi:pseudaminic acid cytidylyltransferase
MNIAIIPARGGSKRISGKNIKLFCGKPIIAYSIAAVQQSGLFDRIICSTDSDEIADVARHYGVETPFKRPAELANDFAGTDAVLIHALKWLSEQGQPADYACCIYATAPFIQAAYLRSGFEQLCKQQATSAFSVATYPYTIFRSLKQNELGRVEMVWPENYQKRSQDFPDVFHDAGQFYWMNVARYLQAGNIFNADAIPIFIPRHLVQDIDTPEDWEVAENMFRSLGFH